VIESIEIENYQSLRSVKLELGAVTTIVGPSDVGKSAFVRAVRAVLLNQRGDEFVSHGANKCRVTLGTEQGPIRWERANSTSYLLPDGRDFTKLAGTVPEEAAEVMGITEVPFESGRVLLNIQSQFGLPFLIAGGATSSRFLGKLSGIDDFLAANREAYKLERDTNRNIEFLRGRRDQVADRVRELKPVQERKLLLEEFKDDLKDFYVQAQEVKELQELARVDSTIQLANDLDGDLTSIKGEMEELKELESAWDVYQDMQVWEDEHGKLDVIYHAKKQYLNKLQKESGVEPLVCPFVDQYDGVKEPSSYECEYLNDKICSS